MLNLKDLSDTTLLFNLKTKRNDEKTIQAEILEYLQEVSRRKLFLKRGYSSFFSFLELELGYCKSMAFYLNNTVKLCCDVHEAKEIIKTGELSFTTAGVIQNFFDREKYKNKTVYDTDAKTKLLMELKGKSKADVEKKLATISPTSVGANQSTRARAKNETYIQFHCCPVRSLA